MNKKKENVISGLRDIYLDEAVFVTALMAAVIHFLLIGYFFWLGVPEMGFYNVFSVLIFVLVFLLLKSNYKPSKLYFLLGSFEAITHAFLATYYIGAGTGFPLFLWLIPSLLILRSRLSGWFALIGCLLIGVIYILLNEVMFGGIGVYAIDQTVEKYTFYACFLFVVSTIIGVTFYYRSIVIKKERIILQEMHHRIKNNLQIVSSIASIRNTDFNKSVKGSVLDELRTDVWYLSAIHNHILVTRTGTTINFSRFMNDVMGGTNPLDAVLKTGGRGNDLLLNLETGIPLGLIISQILECYNQLRRSGVQSSQTEFVIASSNAKGGELVLNFTLSPEIQMDKIQMEESSSEIISLLLEQLNGSYELIQEANKATFRIRYEVI